MMTQLLKLKEDLDKIIRKYDDQIRSDQTGSERSLNNDPSRSDQIRQATEKPNQETQFKQICEKYGVDLEGKDIRGLERNITWVLNNIGSIRSPKAYLDKIIASCPEVKNIGFKVPEKEPESTDIMGIPKEEVEEKLEYLDEHTFNQVKKLIPGSDKLFKSYSDIMKSQMKQRVVTAYAIREGIL